MTLPKRPNGDDPHQAYDPEYAAVIDALDRMNRAFDGVETFRDRVLSHTELDAVRFKRRLEEAERHRDTARALLAAHATFEAQSAPCEAASETFAEQAPEDATNPIDSGDSSENPVDLDDVNDHVRKMHDILESMFENAEAYAAEQEEDMIWTPWVDAEDQVKKLRRAYDRADEVYELTWEMAPNPWPEN